MALIECPDCGKKVSDSAPACPACGRPIAGFQEGRDAGAPLQTVQETSKRLKAHSLLSVAALVAGFMIFMSAVDQPDGHNAALGGSILSTVGLLWFIVTRFRIWWHHK